jgi:hypothetical protein
VFIGYCFGLARGAEVLLDCIMLHEALQTLRQCIVLERAL